MRFAFAGGGHRRRLLLVAVGCFSVASAFLAPTVAHADEPQWIWSAARADKEQVPAEVCYFRKTFQMGKPQEGQVEITCDDAYVLYVNGRKVGEGSNWKILDVYDITKYLVPGKNTIAVKATNNEQGSAGLVGRVVVKEAGNTHVSYPTDATWKASLKEFVYWEKSQFNDVQWVACKAYGALGKTLPWGDEVTVVGGGKGRFKTLPEFKVEWVGGGEDTGSLIAMTFNEFGNLLVSRENGPIEILKDKNHDGLLESTEVFCDKVTNCHGLLALNGKVYAVGTGPEGSGFYKLTDENNSGKAEKVECLLKFDSKMVEHGAHAAVLGPDGLIYIVLGNHATIVKTPESTSPYQHCYDGDMFLPRYEDPGGHAAGIKAPGGTVIRTDTQGSFVEVVAGGFRNAYDMAFNRQGELFTFDSDMEWDEGLPWYRPIRIEHVIPGAEFGWRSGWVNWPDYFVDSLPPTSNEGRGSPTGVAFYDHFMYPVRFHDAMFLGDWSRGRILYTRLKPAGGTYTAETDVFLEGRPLNVTDLAVGPDGWLYFTTGGRDTEGGVYRVVWQGKVPAEITNLGTGIRAALRQPQLEAAWSRQKIAAIKRQLGKEWDRQLGELPGSSAGRTEERLQALNLMQLFGPFPSNDVLVKLTADRDEAIRAKATYLLGLHPDQITAARLTELLADTDPLVQRTACEAFVRAGQTAPVDKLLPLLASPNRFVAWAARRALEQIPAAEWQSAVLKSKNIRVYIQGSISLMTVAADKSAAEAVIARGQQFMKGYVSDPDFIDLLRVMEVALTQGEIKGPDVASLQAQLSDEYPSRHNIINRELVRLLVYLQEPTVLSRMIQQLTATDVPTEEKLHLAITARFMEQGWNSRQKLEMLKFFEQARSLTGGHSLGGYIENVSRDFFAGLTDAERTQVLAEGAKWPSSALSVLVKLPADPGAQTLSQLQQLDRQLATDETEPAKRLQIGIVAVLARSGDAKSMDYLREVFERDPARRGHIAMALSQHPEGANWQILVRSLPIVEGSFAQEILSKLATVDRAPDQPEPIRQVIIRGLKLGDEGGQFAVALLEKWTGDKVSKDEDSPSVAMTAWQKWFAEKYPDQPEAALPSDSNQNHWTYDELITFINGAEGKRARPERGASIFAKAQCIKCHRFGQEGEGIGPDLTTVSQRFQKKEILESILYPSQVISDQYLSKTILTTDGKTYSGIVAPRGNDAVVVLQSDGQKVTIPTGKIEDTKASKKSAMPEGLLNGLTLEEIADLFAYLDQAPNTSITSRRKGAN